jgi:hypothetical protein
MPGALTFKISIFQENVDILPELQNKVKDLTGLFEQIIDQWAKGNPEKFGFAAGASLSGARVDPQVEWQALSPAYFKAKSKRYPDQIMVRTGSLRDSLSNPSLFFQMVNPEQAVFGAPNDADDAMKVQFNWEKRQTIFLGDSDQNMIRELESKYFTVQMKSIKQEIAQMNVDFSNTVAK